MHKWCYEKAECLKNELCSIGMDNLTKEQLEEAYYFSKILKNLVETDQMYHIVDAMEKSEKDDEIMEKIGQYTDYPEKRYYNMRRYANGRFAPGSRRRGYEEKYDMTPEMYKHWSEMDEDERMRDLDRETGRMYYTTAMRNNSGSRDMREGRSGQSRVRYYESKTAHAANTMEDKQAKMKDLEDYAKHLTEDVVEMVADATPEEKTLLKQKMQTLITKIV